MQRSFFQKSVGMMVLVAGLGMANEARAQQPAVTWWEDQVLASNIVLHAPANTLDAGYVYAFEGYMGFVSGVYQHIYTGNLYFEPQNNLVSPASHVGRFWTPYHLHKVIVRYSATVQFTPYKPVQYRLRYPSGTYGPYQQLAVGRTYRFKFSGATRYWIELNDANGRVTLIDYIPF